MHDLCSILLQQWLENANNPILAEEVAFIQQEDDLIQLGSTYKTPVRESIHRFNFWSWLALEIEKSGGNAIHHNQ